MQNTINKYHPSPGIGQERENELITFALALNRAWAWARPGSGLRTDTSNIMATLPRPVHIDWEGLQVLTMSWET